jgi:RNA recognition motif-containing protein
MTIYVGNISYSMKEEDLAGVFKQFGTVSSVKIIRDKKTHRSKGYGFVEMASESDADKAVESLNGTEVGGRSVKVTKANPRKEGVE